MTKIEDVAAMYKGNGPDDENDPDPFHLAKRAYVIHKQVLLLYLCAKQSSKAQGVNIGSKCDPQWTIEQFPRGDRKQNNFNAHRMVIIIVIAGKGVPSKKKKFNCTISYGSAEIGLR